MRLGQISLEGSCTAALFEGAEARPVPGYTFVDLIRRAEAESIPLPQLAASLARRRGRVALPMRPLRPPEVWNCSGTYRTEITSPVAARRVGAPRPGIFLKGTARICVGPGQPIGIRPDSELTVPGPSLALLLGSKGKVLGLTLATDVSAQDIEAENPLYSSESRTFRGSCALGPAILTLDEVPDPYQLTLTCRITRGGNTYFSGSVSTATMITKLEALVTQLIHANPVPLGSVLLTGTGFVFSDEMALRPGDEVTVGNEVLGELTNPVAAIPAAHISGS